MDLNHYIDVIYFKIMSETNCSCSCDSCKSGNCSSCSCEKCTCENCSC